MLGLKILGAFCLSSCQTQTNVRLTGLLPTCICLLSSSPLCPGATPQLAHFKSFLTGGPGPVSPTLRSPTSGHRGLCIMKVRLCRSLLKPSSGFPLNLGGSPDSFHKTYLRIPPPLSHHIPIMLLCLYRNAQLVPVQVFMPFVPSASVTFLPYLA